MIIFCITGGIATGKTTSLDILRKKKYDVINTDEITRSLLKKNTICHYLVLLTFGSCVLDENKSISREKLQQIVFSNTKLRRKLEIIIHPCVFLVVAFRLLVFFICRKKLVFIEIPLLFETGLNNFLHNIIIITSSKTEQIKRFKNRSPEKTIKAEYIIKTQQTHEERAKKSTYVIENNKDIADLEKKVNSVLEQILQKMCSSHSNFFTRNTCVFCICLAIVSIIFVISLKIV